METNRDRRVARAAAAVYLPITAGAAALFALAAALQGRAGPTTVAAGAFWVGLLTLIVLMPLVIPPVRRRVGREDPEAARDGRRMAGPRSGSCPTPAPPAAVKLVH